MYQTIIPLAYKMHCDIVGNLFSDQELQHDTAVYPGDLCSVMDVNRRSRFQPDKTSKRHSFFC